MENAEKRGEQCSMENRMREKLEALYWKMTEWFAKDPKRIQHFVKVHSFAKRIGIGEMLEEKEQFILEAAALTHDIGIRPGEEKYGRCDGKIQEQEGPDAVRQLLKELDFAPDEIERIAWLVGHHHTYENIRQRDYQILVEADFLVNYYEDGIEREQIQKSCRKIFHTETGIRLCETMYGVTIKISETWAQDNIREMEEFIESQGIYIRQ